MLLLIDNSDVAQRHNFGRLFFVQSCALRFDAQVDGFVLFRFRTGRRGEHLVVIHGWHWSLLERTRSVVFYGCHSVRLCAFGKITKYVMLRENVSQHPNVYFFICVSL